MCCTFYFTFVRSILRDTEGIKVLISNRALINLIVVSELPLKIKLYVSLWTSGRRAEQLISCTKSW